MGERRALAGDKKIWVIKAGFPDTPEKRNWSDYIFANILKSYLENQGYYVVVEAKDDWYCREDADVVLALRGPVGYIPDRTNRDCIYILWNLSHPDEVPDEEFNAYDIVCTGSEKESYVNALKERLRVPVCSLPMCIDTSVFYLRTDKEYEKEYDWIFVGNSRHMPRKSVLWAVENHIPLKIWGRNWQYFISNLEQYWMGEFIANDHLPELYHKSKITINDHHEDMLDNGFTNTRILEALACGLPVISDYSEVLESVFGDMILYYKDKEEFLYQTKIVDEKYDEIKAKAICASDLIQEKYSFAERVRQLDALVQEIREHRLGFEKEKVGNVYHTFQQFMQLMHGEVETLDDEQKKLKALYYDLTFQEQLFFERLEGKEKWFFENLVSGKTKEEVGQDRINWGTEKENLHVLLKKSSKTQRDLRDKLEIAYAEKSKINQKLQTAYEEKKKKDLEIKALKNKIANIKGSKTYRLARLIGWPIRFLKKH